MKGLLFFCCCVFGLSQGLNTSWCEGSHMIYVASSRSCFHKNDHERTYPEAVRYCNSLSYANGRWKGRLAVLHDRNVRKEVVKSIIRSKNIKYFVALKTIAHGSTNKKTWVWFDSRTQAFIRTYTTDQAYMHLDSGGDKARNCVTMQMKRYQYYSGKVSIWFQLDNERCSENKVKPLCEVVQADVAYDFCKNISGFCLDNRHSCLAAFTEHEQAYDQSEEFCEETAPSGWRGRLAIINTSLSWSVFYNQMGVYQEVWVGLKRDNGKWFWIDDQADFKRQFATFDTDYGKGISGNKHTCARIKDFWFNDKDCEDKKYQLCEFLLEVDPKIPACGAPDVNELFCQGIGGYCSLSTNSCFKAYKRERTYAEGIEHCMKSAKPGWRGRLLIIPDNKVMHIVQQMEHDVYEYWIGIKVGDGLSGSTKKSDWFWYDGLLRVDSLSTSLYQKITINNGDKGHQGCGFYDFYTRRIEDRSCEKKIGVFCEFLPTTKMKFPACSAPEPNQQFCQEKGGKCSNPTKSCILLSTVKGTFKQATDACKQKAESGWRGRLAVVSSSPVWDAIKQLSEDPEAWVGLQVLSKPQSEVWRDWKWTESGTVVSQFIPGVAWDLDFNAGRNEHCGVLKIKDKKFEDKNCKDAKRYICEFVFEAEIPETYGMTCTFNDVHLGESSSRHGVFDISSQPVPDTCDFNMLGTVPKDTLMSFQCINEERLIRNISSSSGFTKCINGHWEGESDLYCKSICNPSEIVVAQGTMNPTNPVFRNTTITFQCDGDLRFERHPDVAKLQIQCLGSERYFYQSSGDNTVRDFEYERLISNLTCAAFCKVDELQHSTFTFTYPANASRYVADGFVINIRCLQESKKRMGRYYLTNNPGVDQVDATCVNGHWNPSSDELHCSKYCTFYDGYDLGYNSRKLGMLSLQYGSNVAPNNFSMKLFSPGTVLQFQCDNIPNVHLTRHYPQTNGTATCTEAGYWKAGSLGIHLRRFHCSHFCSGSDIAVHYGFISHNHSVHQQQGYVNFTCHSGYRLDVDPNVTRAQIKCSSKKAGWILHWGSWSIKFGLNPQTFRLRYREIYGNYHPFNNSISHIGCSSGFCSNTGILMLNKSDRIIFDPNRAWIEHNQTLQFMCDHSPTEYVKANPFIRSTGILCSNGSLIPVTPLECATACTNDTFSNISGKFLKTGRLFESDSYSKFACDTGYRIQKDISQKSVNLFCEHGKWFMSVQNGLFEPVNFDCINLIVIDGSLSPTTQLIPVFQSITITCNDGTVLSDATNRTSEQTTAQTQCTEAGWSPDTFHCQNPLTTVPATTIGTTGFVVTSTKQPVEKTSSPTATVTSQVNQEKDKPSSTPTSTSESVPSSNKTGNAAHEMESTTATAAATAHTVTKTTATAHTVTKTTATAHTVTTKTTATAHTVTTTTTTPSTVKSSSSLEPDAGGSSISLSSAAPNIVDNQTESAGFTSAFTESTNMEQQETGGGVSTAEERSSRKSTTQSSTTTGPESATLETTYGKQVETAGVSSDISTVTATPQSSSSGGIIDQSTASSSSSQPTSDSSSHPSTRSSSTYEEIVTHSSAAYTSQDTKTPSRYSTTVTSVGTPTKHIASTADEPYSTSQKTVKKEILSSTSAPAKDKELLETCSAHHTDEESGLCKPIKPPPPKKQPLLKPVRLQGFQKVVAVTSQTLGNTWVIGSLGTVIMLFVVFRRRDPECVLTCCFNLAVIIANALIITVREPDMIKYNLTSIQCKMAHVAIYFFFDVAYTFAAVLARQINNIRSYRLASGWMHSFFFCCWISIVAPMTYNLFLTFLFNEEMASETSCMGKLWETSNYTRTWFPRYFIISWMTVVVPLEQGFRASIVRRPLQDQDMVQVTRATAASWALFWVYHLVKITHLMTAAAVYTQLQVLYQAVFILNIATGVVGFILQIAIVDEV